MKRSEQQPRSNPLLELERAVHAEAREWERQRLEERMQKVADRVGKLSPLSQRRAQQARETVVTLRVGAGIVKVIA